MARATRDNLGYLLATASRRWNTALQNGFADAGFPEVRASYGSVLIPLLEEDGLRMGEIAKRAQLSKQTMTALVRLCERDGLVERRADPADGRATLVHLTKKARRFEPVAEKVLKDLDRTVQDQLGSAQVAGLELALKDLVRRDTSI